MTDPENQIKQQCPDCGAKYERTVEELSDEESVTIMSCTECDWEIETVSNLAQRDRVRDDHA